MTRPPTPGRRAKAAPPPHPERIRDTREADWEKLEVDQPLDQGARGVEAQAEVGAAGPGGIDGAQPHRGAELVAVAPAQVYASGADQSSSGGR